MAMSMRALTNRLNALKSTGPKTVKGKLKAAQNAIKHGLLAVGDLLEGENQRQFNDLKVRLMAEFFCETKPICCMPEGTKKL